MLCVKLSSSNVIRTKLLTDKNVDPDRQVKEKLGNSVEKYGVTHCCDGWNKYVPHPHVSAIGACIHMFTTRVAIA
jgi:hypothetical protein